jgi:transcriptional regulator with XRE-family HTH domain
MRALRTRCNLTQEQLAEKLNIGARTIARYESEAPPSGRMLRLLVEFAAANQQPDLERFFVGVIKAEIENTYGSFDARPLPGALERVLESIQPGTNPAAIDAGIYSILETIMKDWAYLYATAEWKQYADARLAQQHGKDLQQLQEMLTPKQEKKEGSDK